MEHVAKWTVVVVTVLAMFTLIATIVTRGVDAAAANRSSRDEAAGFLLLGVLFYLITLISVLIWWQPE